MTKSDLNGIKRAAQAAAASGMAAVNPEVDQGRRRKWAQAYRRAQGVVYDWGGSRNEGWLGRWRLRLTPSFTRSAKWRGQETKPVGERLPQS